MRRIFGILRITMDFSFLQGWVPFFAVVAVALVVIEVLRVVLAKRDQHARRWPRKQRRGGSAGAAQARFPDVVPDTFQLPPQTTSDPLPAQQMPYRRKEYLLSQSERAFYEVLCAAVHDLDVVVCPMVRLCDLLHIDAPRYSSEFWQHFNAVSQKHVDFVVCDRAQLRPLVVVELDGTSHERPDRIDRDGLVNRVLAAARLPVLHIERAERYHTEDLARQIRAAVNLK